MSIDRRRLLQAGAALASTAAASVAATARPTGFEQLPDGVRFNHGDDLVDVRLALPGVASVVRRPAARSASADGLFARSAPGRATIREDAHALHLVGGGLVVTVDKASGLLAFLAPDGTEQIRETLPPAPLPGVDATRRQGFGIARDTPLHGLGQYREPVLDYRGHDQFIAHANSDAASPLLVSPAGWGLLWETATATHLRSRGRTLGYHSIGSDVIRYHVCVGDGIDGVIAGYRRLTGPAALLPRWAYGYWQSKERYQTQAELLAVVAEYRRRRLPLDAIVLDWRYWGDNDRFSAMEFDPAIFPDPVAMTKAVHDADVHLLASVWPAFGPATAIHREMAAGGHLFAGKHWSGGHVFDTSSAAARAIYWRHIKAGLIDRGVDGLWTDGNEPEFLSTGERYGTTAAYASRGVCAAGPIPENQLTFSWWQANGLAAAMRRDRPAQRPIILSRSAYAGQQAFGAVTWSGDIFASWGTLANQIVAAVNFSMAGNPWWTCDIGGFLVNHRFPKGLADPAYVELYIRWFQFGAFLPVFRAHGTHVPRELWRFGEPGTPAHDALEKALRLRYALMPYIYSLAAQAALGDGTVVRGLAMDFADDPAVLDHPAQYMFGRDLLVRVVDRPLVHVPDNVQEFIPNRCIRGVRAPAAVIAFFDGAGFDRKVAERLTDDLKLSWTGDLPAILAGKPYALRISGTLVPEESGVHRLVMMGKGAVKVVVGGRTLVDATVAPARPDGADGGVSFREHEGDGRWEADLALTAGQAVPFTIEQRQPTPDVVSLWIEWITPAQRARMTLPGTPAIDVYLPRGARWRRFGGGPLIDGGRSVSIDAPLDVQPLFVRAGAIVPMTPGIDRSAARPDAIELHVHAGADGAFRFYDDAGDGEGYGSGEHCWTPLAWDDRARRLTIGPRDGGYPGMPRRQTFRVRLVGEAVGTPREVTFTGAATSVRL